MKTKALSFLPSQSYFCKVSSKCMNCVWSGLCRCLAKPSDSGTRVAARLRRQGKAGQHRADSTCSACRGALTREHTTATQATHFYRSWVPLTQDQAGTQLSTWRRRCGSCAAARSRHRRRNLHRRNLAFGSLQKRKPHWPIFVPSTPLHSPTAFKVV